MKRLDSLLRILFLAVFVFLTPGARATGDGSRDHGMDSVEISLLTCSPGNEVWSLYGHTAIRLRDPARQQDLAVNYGMFSFGQKYFALRFVFGLTDYEMGIQPFPMFLMEYARNGRGVVQQTLRLSPGEKAAILQAVYENYLPANRTYRYNYFYDNCTTRARDILVGHLDGRVAYAVDPAVTTSYRDMIHQWNAGHRWARFGNDLLLGMRADAPTDYVQQQFLPDSLRHDFARATVIDATGRRHPLVDSTVVLLRPNAANAPSAGSGLWDSLTPRLLFAALFVLAALVTLYELRRGKAFWLVDVVLFTLDGLAGLVLLAMVFSQHPTVSFNLQILLLNPIALALVYPLAARTLRGRFHRGWDVLSACLLLFLAGGFFQDYAEGAVFLALCLLCRTTSKRFIYKQQ